MLRACVRNVPKQMGGYFFYFYYVSIPIRDYPPGFLSNTNTGSVRMILTIHFAGLLK